MGSVQCHQQFLSRRHSSKPDLRGQDYGLQDHGQFSPDRWVGFAGRSDVTETESGEPTGTMITHVPCRFKQAGNGCIQKLFDPSTPPCLARCGSERSYDKGVT